MESRVQSWRPRTNAFCDFSSPRLWSIAPATTKWVQVIWSAAPVTQSHLPKTERSDPPKMQPFSGNQRPDLLTSLMNMSLALRLPRDMHFPDPLQMSHACHRFCNCYKTFTVCPLLTRCAIWTSKSGSRTVCLAHFDLEMCFAPQQRALFLQLNFQKWSERDVFLTFALANWKSTVFRDFPTFSHTWIFFLLTLSLRWSSLFFSSLLFSSLLFSSLLWLFPPLLFICPYCRKFDF